MRAIRLCPIVALICAIVAPVTAAPPRPADKRFLVIDGDQFRYAGKVFKLKGSNYYPRDYMWAAMWKVDADLVAADAARMRTLGMNCVRILVPYRNGGWGGANPPAGHLDKLTSFINTFGARGIRCVVTLFDWETSFPAAGEKREAEHLRHLEAIVSRLKDNPYVLMWDVKNEPEHPANIGGKDDWSENPEARDKIVSWLERMCNAVRRIDTNHPVCVGLRWANNVDETLPFVDVAMFHSYWPNIGTEQIPNVKKFMGKDVKPIVVEEFGWPSHPTPCEREGGQIVHDFTEQDQVKFYEKHLAAFREHDIAGCIQWMTYDAAKYSNNPKESFEKYFGLWHYDYSLKPVAAVYRDGFKVQPFPVVTPRR